MRVKLNLRRQKWLFVASHYGQGSEEEEEVRKKKKKKKKRKRKRKKRKKKKEKGKIGKHEKVGVKRKW